MKTTARKDPRSGGGTEDDTFGLLRQLLYSFPPPCQKKCSLPKLLHTYKWPDSSRFNQCVVNKSLNRVVIFFSFFYPFTSFCFSGSSNCGNECRRAGHHSFRNKNQTKQHLHKDHLDFIQQMFSLSFSLFLF